MWKNKKSFVRIIRLSHYGRWLCYHNIPQSACTVEPQTKDKGLSGQVPVSQGIQSIEVPGDPDQLSEKCQQLKEWV